MTEPYEYRARAASLAALNRLEESAAMAREGLSHYPDYVPLHTLLSFALHDAGDGKGALAAAQQALALAPDDGEAKTAYGVALFRLKRPKEAVAAIEDALATDPSPFHHVILGRYHLRRVTGTQVTRGRNAAKLSLANRHAGLALEIDPNDVDAHLLRAEVSLARESYSDAERWARSALALDAEVPGGHELLGRIAEARGHHATAGDYYVEAARLDPRSRSGIDRLRNVGRVGAVSFLGWILVTRVLRVVAGDDFGRDLGLWRWVVGVLLVAGVAAWFFVPRIRARRTLSPEARAVLDRHRQMRKTDRWWRGISRRRR